MWTMMFLLIKVGAVIPLILLCIKFDKTDIISTKESMILRINCILLSVSCIFLIIFLKYDKMSMVAQILNIMSSVGLLLYYSKIKKFIFESGSRELYKLCMYYVYISNTAIMSLLIVIALSIFIVLTYIGNLTFLYMMQWMIVAFNILFILIIIGSYLYLYSNKKVKIIKEQVIEINNQETVEKNIFDEIDDLF